jgi:hypothetical protein
MKLTNADIFSAREPLQKLVNEKLPVVVSYKLAKLANKLNEQFQIIESVRQGLVKKYGKPTEDGQSVSIKQDSEDWTRFVEEFNELMSQEVELVVEKVKFANVTLDIEPSVLMALEKFIEVS